MKIALSVLLVLISINQIAQAAFLKTQKTMHKNGTNHEDETNEFLQCTNTAQLQTGSNFVHLGSFGSQVYKADLGVRAQYYNRMFHEYVGTVVAPIRDGRAYIVVEYDQNVKEGRWQDTAEQEKPMFVYEVDANGNVARKIDLFHRGYIYDMITTQWGFIIMYTKRTKMELGILGFEHNGHRRFKKIVHNNRDCAKYDADNQMFLGTDAFGMSCMHSTSAGRLWYANERIWFTIAYANYWPDKDWHTGVTFFSIDQYGGDDQMIQNWLTGHVLDLQLVSDGDKYIIIVSQNDFGMKFSRYNIFDTKDIKQVQPDEYTAMDGAGGWSLGRMGDTVYQPYNKLFSVMYRRWSWKGTTPWEVALIQFDNELTIKNHAVYITGDDAWRVNSIRMQAWGTRLLIQFGWKTKWDADWHAYHNSCWLDEREHLMYQMRLHYTASVETWHKQVSEFGMQASGDNKVLSDGRIAWTYVTQEGNLEYWTTNDPWWCSWSKNWRQETNYPW